MYRVSRVPLHGNVKPEIVPGVGGGVPIVTANVCAGEFPQALLAMTVTVPAVAAAVAMMVSVADVPVHPLGSVHT